MDAIQDNPRYYCNPEDPICGTWAQHRLEVFSANCFLPAEEWRIIVTGWIP